MKIAVYTSIFGGKDLLKENQFLSNDLDYICFTDREVSSKTWKVITKKPTHSDPCRSAKAFKILPHKFLPEYDYSVWIDGNFIVKKHPKDLIEKYDLYNINVNFNQANKKRYITKEDANFLIKNIKQIHHTIKF